MAHVVDANAHVMAADVGDAVPPPGEARDSHEATAEELLAHMRQAGVHQAVIVPHPPGSYDNGYCIEAAQRYPESFVAIGKIDVADPEAVAKLNQLVEQPGIGGLRFELRDGRDPSEWLDAPETIPLWEAAARRSVSVSLPSVRRSDQLPALRRVLERFPTVPIVLLHGMAEVPVDDGPPYQHASDFFALAELPNVYFAFAHREIADKTRGKSTCRAFFEAFVGKFGASHLMWASFFPSRATAEAPLKGLFDPVLEELSFLSHDDLDWVLGETARSLFPSLRGALHNP